MNHAAAWIRATTRRDLSPLGERVAQLVDVWLDGMHHLPNAHRVDWSDEWLIKVPWYGGLSTWDFDLLTRLVVLCHDACIRLEIRSCNPRHVYLWFTPRARDGSTCNGHPTIEDAVERARKRR